MYWTIHKFLILCLVLSSVNSSGIFDNPDVFLTVSSEPDCESRSWYKPWSWFQETNCDRRLELNWINFDKLYSSSTLDSDYVGLFSWDPTSPFSPQPPPPPPEKHKCPVSSVSQAALGTYKTTARYERRDDLSPGMKDPCFLGYWIAYIRVTTKDNGTTTTKVLKSNCLKLHPFWMAELGETIGDLPVTSLIIPGTHNSGSWEKYRGVVSEINPLSAYEITQEESIYDQLMHGIRYLDVRVSYHSILPINFWVSHELLPQIPLTSLLSDVQRFVEETGRKEIVFVDFHRFHSGINRPEIHTQLIHLVDSYLGSYLVPYNRPVGMLTPNQLWNNNNGGNGSRTVFVTYPEPLSRKLYSFLWPPFQHSWANTNNITELENFLSEDLQVFGCRGRYWTLMTELTATASDVLTRPQLGLRGMAQDVNRNVTLWFRRKSWYSRTMAIASDFFLGNNLIEMAIKANAHQAVCNHNHNDDETGSER